MAEILNYVEKRGEYYYIVTEIPSPFGNGLVTRRMKRISKSLALALLKPISA